MPSARISSGVGISWLLLLAPPFDQTKQEPGYIKGYPPGVRENGGQYTHAASWVVMAMARRGSGDEAVELFHMLNPLNHTRTPAGIDRYKAEPYVVAGDVSAHIDHAGRAGWSWYTGSAGWMYRAGLESILGLERRGSSFRVDPCIPSTWPEYAIVWRFGTHALRDHGDESGRRMPRGRGGDARRGSRRCQRDPTRRRPRHPPGIRSAREGESGSKAEVPSFARKGVGQHQKSKRAGDLLRSPALREPMSAQSRWLGLTSARGLRRLRRRRFWVWLR